LDADLEKILNERTSALTKKSTAEENEPEASDSDSEQLQRQKRKKKSVFKKPGFNHVFDSYLLKILEKELIATENREHFIFCTIHNENPSRECFDCSLINLVSN
jgi:hypothetical protein